MKKKIYIYIDCCNGIAISHIIVHAKTPSGIGMSKGWTAAGLSGASKCGEVQMTCALTIQIKIYIYIYCWLFTITIYIYIYHEVYSTSNLQIFCGTPCALHHLLCFAGSDDMCAQTMSKKTCMYTYIYIYAWCISRNIHLF